ncbi:hypothetical protein V8G54_024343 [Vigna mungo]|uniref:Uncharacterized protein n=1 Tax=Vigna mungo TaxID=3915 RepID=A0AAQ3N642_VIGMU
MKIVKRCRSTWGGGGSNTPIVEIQHACVIASVRANERAGRPSMRASVHACWRACVQACERACMRASGLAASLRPSLITLERKVATVFIGTFIIIFAATAAAIVNQNSETLKTRNCATTPSLTVMVVIFATGHKSRAHINPGSIYIGVQVLASVCTAFALKGVYHPSMNGGVTVPSAIDTISGCMRARARVPAKPTIPSLVTLERKVATVFIGTFIIIFAATAASIFNHNSETLKTRNWLQPQEYIYIGVQVLASVCTAFALKGVYHPSMNGGVTVPSGGYG